MADPGWFETEDPLDEIQQAFADGLRARATGWPLDPAYTLLAVYAYDPYGRPLPAGETTAGRLLVYADIVDTATNVNLLTVGAYLDRDHLYADWLHNQLFTLPDRPSSLALTATGTPAGLAALTADWFEALLRRPVVRHEWLRAGVVHAHRSCFADSQQPLVEGRVRTAGLGPPDRTVPVRADLR